MTNESETTMRSAGGLVWTGRILSILAILFLTMDGVMKLAGVPVVGDAMKQLGWPADPGTLRMLAVLLLGSTLLYAIPRTSVLGAILLTGYLGGTVATHVRVGNPLLSHVLFGVYIGVMVWAGLWLRNPSLRAVLPIRSNS